MAISAPVIVAEMADWVALGGGSSGIVGNRSHSYGYHRAASEVGRDDYSRWRDPQGADGPYVDWSYACAGDFRHGGDPRLRAMHARVLARLMRGELPMICEFIGQPYADQPVLYWARWNGISTLLRYTGAGHDLWSHIAWYRSRVDERAYLWRQEDDMEDWGQLKRPPTVPSYVTRDVMIADLWAALVGGTTAYGDPVQPWALFQRFDAIEAQLAAQGAVIEQLAAAVTAGGGSVDAAAILAGVDERLARVRDEIDARVRDAVADGLEGGAAQVRAE